MNNMERMMNRIQELLQKPFWVIDILPEQVKSDRSGQYFEVENFFLKDKDLRKKQLNVILKLNCYCDIRVWIDSQPVENPSPNKLKELIGKVHLNVEIEDALIMIDDTDTHMTIFNADGKLLEMVKQLVTAEGMFMWEPTV